MEEIRVINYEAVAKTTYFDFKLDYKGKEVFGSAWEGCDDNLGMTDSGYEINKEIGDKLKDWEIEEIEKFIDEGGLD